MNVIFQCYFISIRFRMSRNLNFTTKSSNCQACHVVEKGLHSVPISHFETLLLFYFLYVMNKAVIFQTYWNTLDAERCFWYQSARSGAESLLNARSAEGILLTLHSAHILWSDTATQMCVFFVNDCQRTLHRVPVTKYTVKVSHRQVLVAFFIK